MNRARRLDLIEEWWLVDPDPSVDRLVEYLRAPLPLPGCQLCTLPGGKKLALGEISPSCDHGPPRARGEDGKPISAHAVRKDCYVIRDRIQARASISRDKNWQLSLRRCDEVFKRALRAGSFREALAAACRRADLDGSRQAAEEAQQPTLGEQALALCARFADWTPAPPKRSDYSRAELEVIYARGIHLAQRATDSVRQGRRLPKPPDSEIDRRLWIQARIAEEIAAARSSPGLTPAERRDAIYRGAASYALGARDADLADRLAALESKLAEEDEPGAPGT